MGRTEKIKMFLCGLVVAFGVTFLFGAGRGNDAEVSRYQMSVVGQSSEGIFVIDTETGEVKIVHYRNSKGDLTVNKLGKHFSDIPAWP